MRMKSITVVVALGLVVAAVVVFRAQRGGPQRRAADPELSAGPLQAVPPASVGQVSLGDGSEQAAESVAATDSSEQVAAIEVLLARRRPTIQPAEIPILSGRTEEELIRRYRAEETIPEKLRILRVLAFGGGDASVAVLTNAIMREFEGYPASADDSVLLGRLPGVMGLLAHRNDKALQFLLDAVEPGSDFTPGLWQTERNPPRTERVMLRCFQGLGISGRSEVRALLSKIRSQPVYPYTSDLASGIIDAAFYTWLVESRGWVEAVPIAGDADRLRAEFEGWIARSEDGREWDAWGWRVRAEAQEKARRP